MARPASSVPINWREPAVASTVMRSLGNGELARVKTIQPGV